MDRIKSRKFIFAVVAAVIAFGNALFDWGFKTEEVLSIISPLMLFIGVEGALDIKKHS